MKKRMLFSLFLGLCVSQSAFGMERNGDCFNGPFEDTGLSNDVFVHGVLPFLDDTSIQEDRRPVISKELLTLRAVSKSCNDLVFAYCRNNQVPFRVCPEDLFERGPLVPVKCSDGIWGWMFNEEFMKSPLVKIIKEEGLFISVDFACGECKRCLKKVGRSGCVKRYHKDEIQMIIREFQDNLVEMIFFEQAGMTADCFEGLEGCPSFKSIAFDRCENIGDEIVNYLPESLEAIELYNCDAMTDAGRKALCEKCQNLKSLDIFLTSDSCLTEWLPFLPEGLEKFKFDVDSEPNLIIGDIRDLKQLPQSLRCLEFQIFWQELLFEKALKVLVSGLPELEEFVFDWIKIEKEGVFEVLCSLPKLNTLKSYIFWKVVRPEDLSSLPDNIKYLKEAPVDYFTQGSVKFLPESIECISFRIEKHSCKTSCAPCELTEEGFKKPSEEIIKLLEEKGVKVILPDLK